MVAIYDHVLLERRYDANKYLHLLEAEGGVMTAKDFLSSPGFGPGFEGLWQRGPLEKTMEYLVLQTQFSGLFTETEKETMLKEEWEFDKSLIHEKYRNMVMTAEKILTAKKL